MGEKRLVSNASRKKSWIISACFSILGDECLGDCQESNRAGLIADANKCCKSLAFLSTAKKAFPSRKESRSNLRGHGKQVVTSRGTERVGQYWSLEATSAVSVVCNPRDLPFLPAQVYCKVPVADPALHRLLAGRSHWSSCG